MPGSCETQLSCREKFIGKIKGSMLYIAGSIIGAAAGYIYYLKVGCSTGTCPITSNPWISTLWGAAIGFLAAGIIKPSRKKDKHENTSGENNS